MRRVKEERKRKILELLEEYPTTVTPKAEIEKQYEALAEILWKNGVQVTPRGYEDEGRFVRYSFSFKTEKQRVKALSLEYEIVVGLGLDYRIRSYADWREQAVIFEIAKLKNSAERKSIVGLKKLLDAPMKTGKDGEIFAVFMQAKNQPVFCELSRMAHLLLGGNTGAGKSCALHAFLISLTANYSPEEIKFLLIDYKQVEFELYEGLPYLIGKKPYSDFKESLSVLQSTVEELERRFNLFKELSVRSFAEYTEKSKEMGLPPLARIVVVIDEIADAMLWDKEAIEEVLLNLLSRGRAAGIHVILSTQRMDREVLSSALRSACLTKLALTVSMESDSRFLLEENGAELLLGLGDALYRSASMPSALRGQIAYLSNREMARVIAFLKSEK